MYRSTLTAFILLMCAFVALSPAQEEFDESFDGPEYVFFDETPITDLVGWRTFYGDSMAWADPAYDDTHWEWDKGSGLWISDGGPGKGTRWYRKEIFFPGALESGRSLALYQVAAVSASEIYWDGQLVARNGEVGESPADEVPGRSGRVFPIHRSLTSAGRHVIAMRMSNHHSFSGLVAPPVQLAYFGVIQMRLFRSGALALFLAGIFVVTAIFHIAMLLGHANKWPSALFSAFCLSCATYIVIQSMLRYFQIDLGYYFLLGTLNDIPWFFMMSLLPIFFLFEFSAPYQKRLSVLIAVMTLAIVLMPRFAAFGVLPVEWLPALDRMNRIQSISTIVLSIFVTVWAIRRRRPGSVTVLVGLLIFLIGAYVSYRTRAEHGWAIGFAFVILVITVSLSRQMAERNRRHQETQLRSARLEIELLKRHIQPHFLLNSLNSIVAWLEEEPKTAGRLVNALADELRMLLSFSSRKTIKLEREIRLCEAQLKVMSLRQEKRFEMRTEGIDGSERLPPLVIHTLVENGLTHGYRGKDHGVFTLRGGRRDKTLTLMLHNDSAAEARREDFVEGTGLRYVRTRLEEAFPGRWSLAAGPVDDGWQVTVEIEGEGA
ncbi:MAG: hypothetical protein GF418_07615 [Chitinivibrionales bacterium]|nr:hypothetical protein [Chitinivibrionales bacterium]MBD3395480.1 hypothetical protein [Chitinivibrionales bacterium]